MILKSDNVFPFCLLFLIFGSLHWEFCRELRYSLFLGCNTIIISWKLCLLPCVVSYQCIFNLSLYTNSFLLVEKHAHISSYSLINKYKIIFKIPFPFSHIPVLYLIVKLFWKSWEMANLTQPMSVPLISEVSPRSDPDQVCAHNQSTVKVIAFMQPTLSKYCCR